MATTRYAQINEAVTLWITYSQLIDPTTDPETRAFYNPTTPTLVIERPDGTELPPMTDLTQLTILGVPQVGKYTRVYVFTAVGVWRYKGVEPDASKPSYTEATITILPAIVP